MTRLRIPCCAGGSHPALSAPSPPGEGRVGEGRGGSSALRWCWAVPPRLRGLRVGDTDPPRAFVLLAAEVGLWVILRPGPYICSEMDLGGLPR